MPLEVAVSNPVPGHTVKTPFHKRGPKWRTCKLHDKGTKKQTGLHTGVDIPAPLGTPVVAARAGVTKHVDFGPAFGTKQLVVLCDDGTEDFYAHMSARKPGGRKVNAGDKIGEVGNSSSFKIGFHLHFERHKKHADNWGCLIVVNPEASLRAGESTKAASSPRVLLSELRFGTKSSNSVRRLQRTLNKHREPEDPKVSPTGNYLVDTDAAVRRCQERHNFGADAVKKSFVGPLQAAHLFANTKNIVDDL
jgi:peptidase M23-like protein